jgi:predicted transposase/invertase (TIGR01784 family)
MNRYNGPPFEGFDIPVSGVTHFIRATSDVGFKIMMSDPQIAESLVNELFKSINLAPVRLADQGRLEVPLQGHGSFATMDYHAITANREHIIIEMQMIRHDNFDKRVLFYAASTFANQEFEGGEWAPQIKDVYAIQFVDYFTQGSSPVKHYEMINKFSLKIDKDGQLLPLEAIRGIHLIQVELKGEGIRDIKFPVEDRLTDLEWWYYIIKYADQFDANEIERCKTLGLPERMEQALHQLEYGGLDPKKREEYTTEVKDIDTYDDELKRAELLGRLEGELKGKLEGLFNGFIDFNRISPSMAEAIKTTQRLLPRNLVQEIGDQYIKERKISQEQLKHFIELLAKNGILSD